MVIRPIPHSSEKYSTLVDEANKSEWVPNAKRKRHSLTHQSLSYSPAASRDAPAELKWVAMALACYGIIQKSGKGIAGPGERGYFRYSNDMNKCNSGPPDGVVVDSLRVIPLVMLDARAAQIAMVVACEHEVDVILIIASSTRPIC